MFVIRREDSADGTPAPTTGHGSQNSDVQFTLRPFEPADGPALGALLAAEAATTAMAMTTRYHHDVYASLLVQHPDVIGVVATAPGYQGLVGMATAFLDEVQVEGQLYPRAQLENLKVSHAVRRRGLGRQLAAWRIAEARRRFGRPGVVMAGVEGTNAASLATARSWANQILGPLRIVIGPTQRSGPRPAGLVTRDIDDGDVEEVVTGSNAFHADTNLYPRPTPELLRAWLAPVDPGGRVRQYRVAVSPAGSILAGALVVQRFELMVDQIDRLPTPLAILSRFLPLVPPDGVIRTVEVMLPWFAPGQLEAGRRLWEQIRHEWHGRATHVAAVVDPKSLAADMCRVSPLTLGPRLKLMVPVDSPVPLSESRPVVMIR
jgi:GNAT superfamily N-acetyltransferase